jgi:hypothetical protein
MTGTGGTLGLHDVFARRRIGEGARAASRHRRWMRTTKRRRSRWGTVRHRNRGHARHPLRGAGCRRRRCRGGAAGASREDAQRRERDEQDAELRGDRVMENVGHPELSRPTGVKSDATRSSGQVASRTIASPASMDGSPDRRPSDHRLPASLLTCADRRWLVNATVASIRSPVRV